MNKVFIIHPIDVDLRFFDKDIKDILYRFTEIVRYVRLEADEESHKKAYEQIQKLETNDLIIFLCHGGSNYLNGCRYFYSDDDTDIQFDYNLINGNFIDKRNVSILKDKNVICVSCYSGYGFAKMAVENGVKHCIGFKELVFDDLNKINSIDDCDDEIVKFVEEAFAGLLFKSIDQLIDNNITFTQFTNYLKLLINKECDEIILKSKPSQFYRKANALIDIKDGLTLFGNGSTVFRQ